jgi:arsenate reductase-like glutaredoxin family protein
MVCGSGSHQAGRKWFDTRLHYSPDADKGGSGQIRSLERTEANHRDEAGVPGAPVQTRQVQVFGTKKNADTRKALRFFAERRILTHFVDFNERGPALGELRRFSERYGVSALVDRESRRFLDLGLQRSMHSDDWWLQRLTEEPGMLKQPLVRFGKHVTVGLDEDMWREWLST